MMTIVKTNNHHAFNQRQQQDIIAAGNAFGAAFANHVAEQQPAAAASTATGSTSSRGTDIRSDAAGNVAFANTDAMDVESPGGDDTIFANVKINLHLLIYPITFMAKYAGGGIENNYLIYSQFIITPKSG